jgi:hypothetical protein
MKGKGVKRKEVSHSLDGVVFVILYEANGLVQNSADEMWPTSRGTGSFDEFYFLCRIQCCIWRFF